MKNALLIIILFSCLAFAQVSGGGGGGLGGTCTNQVVTAISVATGVPTCTTVTSSYTSGTFTATAHNLLSAIHGDTTAAAAVRGGGIFATGATPLWTQVAHSATTGGYFKWNGTDIVASTGAASGTGACTNQVATTLNADAAPTCSSVSNAMLSNSSITINTTSPVTGGATPALGGSVTVACATCATTTNGGALSGTAPITVSASGVIAGGGLGTVNGALKGNGSGTITQAGCTDLSDTFKCGFVISGWVSNTASNPFTSGTNLYLAIASNGSSWSPSATLDARYQYISPIACTARSLFVNVGVRGTTAVRSSGSTSISIYINGVLGNNTIADNTIFTTAGPTVFSDTSHTDAIAQGAAVEIRVQSSTWSTAPTSVDIYPSVGCSIP